MTDDFRSSVQRQIERLQHCSYQDIEAEVAQKRRAWFRKIDRIIPDRPTPRQAFNLLFFDYMGLSPADLPIVSETEMEIVWQSVNPCPTLEAVQALGLDTRVVCRATTERSTQAFVSQIDPQLRFLRNYEEIRPYANHCREMIVRIDFEAMMRLALEEAEVSRREGNEVGGAVVVLGQRILSRAHTTNLHAEANAIRRAMHVLGDNNLGGAMLFSTGEPCAACFSLATEANLSTIVSGVSLTEGAWWKTTASHPLR